MDHTSGNWDIVRPYTLHPRRLGLDDPWRRAPAPSPRGFTLPELLVVIVIILLVSVLAIAVVLPAYNHREVSAAGRTLQGAIVGAQSRASATGKPAGIRLVPDPTFLRFEPALLPNGTPNPRAGQVDPSAILAYNRIIPIEVPPSYQEGRISVHQDGMGSSNNYAAAIRMVNGQPGVPCLVVEQAVYDQQGAPNSPTSWFWNIRVGDQIQIGDAGPWYTVVGPMAIGPGNGGNSELFVNIGKPGTPLPTLTGGVPCEYLLLVNGRDDNANGFIDEGFDGIDNNRNGVTDEAAEWEQEQWLRPPGR